MCIAIVVPGGKRLTADTLRRCFRSNSDGAGIAYINRGRVMVAKGFMEADDLVRAYDMLSKKFGDNPMLVHCRIATKGEVNKDNCHPFKFKGGAMIHNGSLWSGGRADEMSDTREFVEDNGPLLSKEFVEENEDAIEKAVGWNKLAFLWNDGSYSYINKRGWTEDDGILYSNTTYKSWAGSSCSTAGYLGLGDDFND